MGSGEHALGLCAHLLEVCGRVGVPGVARVLRLALGGGQQLVDGALRPRGLLRGRLHGGVRLGACVLQQLRGLGPRLLTLGGRLPLRLRQLGACLLEQLRRLLLGLRADLGGVGVGVVAQLPGRGGAGRIRVLEDRAVPSAACRRCIERGRGDVPGMGPCQPQLSVRFPARRLALRSGAAHQRLGLRPGVRHQVLAVAVGRSQRQGSLLPGVRHQRVRLLAG